MGRGRGRGDPKRGGGGRGGGDGYRGGRNGGNFGTATAGAADGMPFTAGQVGLDVHSVSEVTRIALDRQLHAFRDDESATTLAFPPTLDNTSRKFVHEAVKRLGLTSKSKGKGDARFITVSKKKRNTAGDADHAELPPMLILGRARKLALDKYFARQPPGQQELDEVMAAAAGPGMHAAAELATQKKHKEGLLDRQARAMSSQGASAAELQQRVNTYRLAQSKRERAAGFSEMIAFRRGLPAWDYRDSLVDMVNKHQACLVSGETGCGKSTQVPQFLLDDPSIGPGCKIVCTQPRRISAIAVAERIADERGEKIGGKVGYTIRLESAVSKDTQLILMTPGILLKKLGKDPLLKEYTHVLIDEVHERDRNSEFLLIVLRGLLAKRPDLRLVLMSATLQQGKYSGYFGGCPITTIGARTFPVQAFFLEDVLVQTKYLEEIGVATLDGGKGGDAELKALANEAGGDGLGEDGGDSYKCALCGQSGFRSAEELGTHAAMCFGTDGLDPALEGLTAEGIRLLMDTGYGRIADDSTTLDEAEDAIDGRGETLYAEGRVRNGDCNGAGELNLDMENDFDADSLRGAPEVDMRGETADSGAVILDAVDKDGSASAEVMDNDGVDDEFAEAHTESVDEDDEDADAGLAAEDDMDGGLHDALALGQKWDGRGTFRAERASATTGRAEELLTRYQFAFDDENVDHGLVECLLRYLCKSAYEDGAVLVFLPGWDDITRLGEYLRSSAHFSDDRKFQILPLHSGVPTAKQRQVFARPPPGCRKIVLSTNIAETSITIDDVAFVIDSGRAKESSYDPHLKIKTLVPQWVSKASARQRRGRAGRTKAGVCFHLFSARRHESLRDHQESELLRTPLEEVVLQAKMLGLANGGPRAPDSAAGFLSQAIDAPPELSLRNALQLLQSLGALDDNEELTDLGARLAGISIDPRVGKMVLWSYMLGCAAPALTAACAMTYKDPFVLPMNPAQRKEAKAAKVALAQGSESDLIALLRALESHADAKAKGGVGAAAALARRCHLNHPTLGMIWEICQQVARELKNMGLPLAYDWGNPCNSNSRDVSLLSSVLCAGLYPNVALRRPGGTNFKTLGGHTARSAYGIGRAKDLGARIVPMHTITLIARPMQLHMSSINASRNQRLAQPNAGKQTEFIAFGEMTRTATNFVMSNTTPVSPLALLLLCGNLRADELFLDEGEVGDSDSETEEADVYDDREVAMREPAGLSAVRGPTELLLELDDWVHFRVPAEQGRNLLVLRNRLHSAFAEHMQTNACLGPGRAADAIATANALLHEPSVQAAAAASFRHNSNRGQQRNWASSGGARPGRQGEGGEGSYWEISWRGCEKRLWFRGCQQFGDRR